MQMQRANAHNLDINGRSAVLENFAPPHDKYCTLDWDWALNEIQKGLEDGRTEPKPNGGYVVNGMGTNDYFLEQVKNYLQKFDRDKIVRIQMYVAISMHSVLFPKHNDPGQRSVIIQGAGRTAVVADEQVVILEKGDMMFLNGDEHHRFTSLGPRFSITVSLEEE